MKAIGLALSTSIADSTVTLEKDKYVDPLLWRTKTNIYTLPSTRNICQRTGIWTDARCYAIHNIGVLDPVSLQFLS